MYSPPSHKEGLASQHGASRGASRTPPIDFYSGVGDDEMPLTGGALRDVLEAGSRAAAERFAGTVQRPSPGRQRLPDPPPARCPVLGATRRDFPDGEQGRRDPALREEDHFVGLSDEDMALIGPVLQAAAYAGAGNDAASSGAMPSHWWDAADNAAGDAMRYRDVVQTTLATVGRDAVDVEMGEPLASGSGDANATLAQFTIDRLLSGGARHVAASGIASVATRGSTILADNPLLLGLLEAPMVTSSDCDAYGLPSTISASVAFALPGCQPTWRNHAQAYTMAAQTVSAAPIPAASVLLIDGAVTGIHAQAGAQAMTRGPATQRVTETTDTLRLLAAVARRDIELPWATPTDPEAVPRYDARFLLCAAYRAIILNAPRNRGWLPVKRFADALGLDASSFARWTSLYRRDDGPSNAFWDTLAPHAWADAFAVVDRLETQHDARVPTLGDLAGTHLSGRLHVGRVKRRRAQLHPIGYEQPEGSAAVGAAPAESVAPIGTTDTTEHHAEHGSIVAAALPSSDIARARATDAAAWAPPQRSTAWPMPTFDALRDVARSVRLVAAASCGDIVAERTESLSHAPPRRYDPRHLLIAVHDALAVNLRDGGFALSLRSFSQLVGLNPRTVYAWRYSYRRSGIPAADFAQSVVAGCGSDQPALVASLEAVMRERAPREGDLRGTPLDNRMLQRFESTLGLSSSDLQEDRARRVKALPLPGVPEVMRGMIGMMRHAVAPPFRTPASESTSTSTSTSTAAATWVSISPSASTSASASPTESASASGRASCAAIDDPAQRRTC